MGIDRIRSLKPYRGIDIRRDKDIYGDQFYIGNGQGCATLFFPNRKAVERYIRSLKVGSLSVGDPEVIKHCDHCNGRYSYGTKEYKKYPNFACAKTKKKIVARFSGDTTEGG